MVGYTKKIREISARLLKEGIVEMVIGFRKGTLPMMNEPHFIRHPEDAEKLVWDGNCGINLANYLTDRKEKIGIIAKGCDSRNIITHIIENKIQRDQLFIVGVPCKGMIDRHRIHSMSAKEIKEVVEEEENVIIKGEGFEQILKKRDILVKSTTRKSSKTKLKTLKMI